MNTRARYVGAIGVTGAAILAEEEEAGRAAGSKDHWMEKPSGTGCGELRDMSEAQSDMLYPSS